VEQEKKRGGGGARCSWANAKGGERIVVGMVKGRRVVAVLKKWCRRPKNQEKTRSREGAREPPWKRKGVVNPPGPAGRRNKLWDEGRVVIRAHAKKKIARVVINRLEEDEGGVQAAET